MKRTEVFQSIIRSILKGDAQEVLKAINYGMVMSISAEEIVQEALLPATVKITDKFQGAEFFIPDVILASHAIEAGLYALKPHIKTKEQNRKVVAIGTVAGDLHDIGKNLIAITLGYSGFQVIDLGVNVSAAAFVEAVKDKKPDILAMSALLTTTMGEMVNVIEQIEEHHLRHVAKILIGGGPVTREFAKSIGADGYAPVAREAIKVARELVR